MTDHIIRPHFDGEIGRTHHESTPWYEEPPHPGEGAPNVVFILIDDLGFAQLGCYGSDIDTGSADLPLYMRMITSSGTSIGYDHGSPVSQRYDGQFAFGGDLHEVVIELAPSRDPEARRAAARAEMSRQ